MSLHERIAADGYWRDSNVLSGVQSGEVSCDPLISALGACVPTEVARRIDEVHERLTAGVSARRPPMAALIPLGRLAAHNGESDCLLKVVEESRIIPKQPQEHAGILDSPEEFDQTAAAMQAELLYGGKTRTKTRVALPDGKTAVISRSVGYFQTGNVPDLLVGKGSYWLGRGVDDLNAVWLKKPAPVGQVRRHVTGVETTETRIHHAQLIVPSGIRKITRVPRAAMGFASSPAGF